eukprot:scaffold736_cov254-Pinguiococcus_pyrenoidosus.AAC.28
MAAYALKDRIAWASSFPQQCVLGVHARYWTHQVEAALRAGAAASRAAKAFQLENGGDLQFRRLQDQMAHQLKELEDLCKAVQEPQTSTLRSILSALVIANVHHRDVVKKLVDDRVASAKDFAWIQQLRHYTARGSLYAASKGKTAASATSSLGAQVLLLEIEMLTTRRPYGYEYVGNFPSLVITPLTERCFQTLLNSLSLGYGGALLGGSDKLCACLSVSACLVSYATSCPRIIDLSRPTLTTTPIDHSKALLGLERRRRRSRWRMLWPSTCSCTTAPRAST